MIEKVMKGSVKMLADQGWDGVKFDSCSMFHNLTRWAELINQTGRPVLIEVSEECPPFESSAGVRLQGMYDKFARADQRHEGIFG